MKKLKLTLLLSVLFMLVFGLAACGGDDEPAASDDKPGEVETDDDNETADEPEDTEGDEAEDAGEKYEGVDLGGRVIRIANHWDMTPTGGTELSDQFVQRHADIEEKYNITIEYVEVTWDEKIPTLTNSILANEPFADLVSITSDQASALVQEEYLIPINDLTDMNTINLSDTLIDIGTIGEDLYMLNQVVNQSGGLFYNKTMFDQAGLDDPYDLYQAGEWTWDAMLEAAKELTAGEQYGLGSDGHGLARWLVFSNEADILNMETFEVGIDSPEALEAYEFFASLYHEHNVIKPNDGDNYGDPKRFFNEGLVGMVDGYSWEMDGRSDLPFEWGYVMYPKGPNASDHMVPVRGVEGMVIPVGVEDPEMVFQIWEDLQSWDIVEQERNEWFEIISPTMETYDTLVAMQDSIRKNYYTAYDLEDAFYEMYDNIIAGTESPAQAISRVKPEAQARVDAYLN